jgi:hypothetical protein
VVTIVSPMERCFSLIWDHYAGVNCEQLHSQQGFSAFLDTVGMRFDIDKSIRYDVENT